MTGKINFQTGKAILLPVEFKEFQEILTGNKRYYRRYRLPPEKENNVSLIKGQRKRPERFAQ